MSGKINLKIFCPRIRKQIVEMHQEGKSITRIAEELKTSRRTVYRWINRYDLNNEAESLSDRKSAPKRKPRKTHKDFERLVIKLRDKRGWSSQRIHLCLKNLGLINPSTGKHLSEFAIRNIFERYKRGYSWDKKKRKKPVIIRYEKQRPGELVHIDVKKLSNVKGENPKKKKYEAAIVDDCTRLTYLSIIPDKKATTLAVFFARGTFYFKEHYDIQIEAVLSDNGKEFTYHDKNIRFDHSFELMCRRLNVKHKYTKVRRPQTNGKVERIWRTCDTELYTKKKFKSHEHRNKELAEYLHYYNNHRMHMGLNGLTPMQKLRQIRAKEHNSPLHNQIPNQ